MLKFPSFIKLPQHRSFVYKPLYYDEAKEKLKQREEKTEIHFQNNKLRDKIHQQWGRGGTYSKKIKQSNTRLLLILLGIIAFTYFILK